MWVNEVESEKRLNSACKFAGKPEVPTNLIPNPSVISRPRQIAHDLLRCFGESVRVSNQTASFALWKKTIIDFAKCHFQTRYFDKLCGVLKSKERKVCGLVFALLLLTTRMGNACFHADAHTVLVSVSRTTRCCDEPKRFIALFSSHTLLTPCWYCT